VRQIENFRLNQLSIVAHRAQIAMPREIP
jgi:hypothetical protein